MFFKFMNLLMILSMVVMSLAPSVVFAQDDLEETIVCTDFSAIPSGTQLASHMIVDQYKFKGKGEGSFEVVDHNDTPVLSSSYTEFAVQFEGASWINLNISNNTSGTTVQMADDEEIIDEVIIPIDNNFHDVTLTDPEENADEIVIMSPASGTVISKICTAESVAIRDCSVFSNIAPAEVGEKLSHDGITFSSSEVLSVTENATLEFNDSGVTVVVDNPAKLVTVSGIFGGPTIVKAFDTNGNQIEEVQPIGDGTTTEEIYIISDSLISKVEITEVSGNLLEVCSSYTPNVIGICVDFDEQDRNDIAELEHKAFVRDELEFYAVDSPHIRVAKMNQRYGILIVAGNLHIKFPSEFFSVQYEWIDDVEIDDISSFAIIGGSHFDTTLNIPDDGFGILFQICVLQRVAL